jgi:soluble lytic murein transglycosylase-like protein
MRIFNIIGLGVVMSLYFGVATAENDASIPDTRRATQNLVMEEALKWDVPVSLALAVAETESNFNPNALSPVGARGVMQIMPDTAEGEYGIHRDLLWNPRVNVRIGMHFLRRLIDKYDGRVELALSWYNGGSAVGSGSRARVIPATRPYINKVRHKTRGYCSWSWLAHRDGEM